MKPSEFTLLIHHHDVTYVDGGKIWVTANIARWIDSLAAHFKQIGLLLYRSPERIAKQDSLIAADNVTLHSLGPPGRFWDRITRMRRIRAACQLAGKSADGLLVRGFTPRQHAIWKSTPVERKAFLLVTNPKREHLKYLTTNWTQLTWKDIVSEILAKRRESEFRTIANSSSLILANSPAHVDAVKKFYQAEARFVPTNTISEAEFASFEVRPISDCTHLLYCGQILFLKGLRELIAAVSILNRQGQPCRLDIVGATVEPAYSQLVQLAGQLGIAGLVRWHGYVPFGPQLFAYYRAADIFILPSYSEGFARVLWEAAANCCPIISTDVGGIPALIQDGDHAVLIPPKDAQAIVDGVLRLKNNPALVSRLVTNAYRLAWEYTVEGCAQMLADTLASEWA